VTRPVRLDRRHVDDRAPFGHQRHDAAEEVGGAGEVLVHEGRLSVVGQIEERRLESSGGVVHEDVDRPERLPHLLDESAYEFAVAHVEDAGDAPASLRPDGPGDGVEGGLAVADGEVGAETGEGEGDRLADATGRSGDHGDLAGERNGGRVKRHRGRLGPPPTNLASLLLLSHG